MSKITDYQQDFLNMERIHENNALGRLITVTKLSQNVKIDSMLETIQKLPYSIPVLNYHYFNGKIKSTDPFTIEARVENFLIYGELQRTLDERYRGLLYKNRAVDVFIARIKKEYFLVVYTAHLFCDATGIMNLNEKIFSFYDDNSLMEGQLEIDFFEEYSKYRSSPKYLKDKLFWETQAEFLADNIEFKQNSFSVESIRKSVVILDEIENNIVKICENFSISKALLMASFFAIYKFKETGIRTAVVGVPISTQKKNSKGLIGHYINVLPIKLTITEDTFGEQIAIWKKEWFLSLKHAKFPSIEINKFVRERGNKSDYIECLVNYIYAEFSDNLKKYSDSDVIWEGNTERVFPLQITISNRNQPLIEFDAKKELFTSVDVRNMELEFYYYINKLVENRTSMISEMTNIKCEDSVSGILNNIIENNDSKKCLVTERESVTYGELNKRSNKIYQKLLEEKITQQSVIAVYMDKGIDIIATMIGVMRANCIYLPLSKDFPKARIDYIISDAKPKVIIYQGEMPKEIDIDNNTLLFNYASLKDSNKENNEFTSNLSIRKKDLLYVIYTSGTTGKPKAVGITNENLASLFNACSKEFTFESSDTWIQLHANTFDFSIWEIFGALLNAAKLVIPQKSTILDKRKLANLINENSVNVLNITPQAFYQLISNNQYLEKDIFKYVIFGGDKLNFEKIESFYAENLKTELINMYGITEITVHATFKKIDKGDFENNISNIGKPLSSLKIILMNENEQVNELGETGEIVLVGSGVAEGYINNKAETRKKFKNIEINGEIHHAYFSGDLGRWLDSDELEYLDRMDSVVNIRGFRVGLEEINSVVNELKWVRQSTSWVDKKGDFNQIICAVETDEEYSLENVKNLRNHIQLLLPDYMIPNSFFFTKKMPMNFNGKIDKDVLRGVSENYQIEESNVSANSNVEIHDRIKQVWKEILSLSNDSIDEKNDFFVSGGDSIATIQFLTELEDFGIFIEINEFIENPTLSFCFSKIPEKNDNSKNAQLFEAYNVPSFLPLVANYGLLPSTTLKYVQSVSVEIPIVLAKNQVVELIENLQLQFDSLRVAKIDMSSNIMIFSNKVSNNYSLTEWEYKKSTYEKLLNEINKQAVQNLSDSIILHVDKINKDSSTELVFTISHLLIDGFSWTILLNFIEKYIFDGYRCEAVNKDADVSYQKYLIEEYKELDILPVINKDVTKCNKNFYKDTKVTYIETSHTDSIDTKIVESIYLTAFLHGIFRCEIENLAEVIVEKEVHNRTNKNAKVIGWLTRLFDISINIDNDDIVKLFKRIYESLVSDNELTETEFVKDFILNEAYFRHIRFNYLPMLSSKQNNKVKVSNVFFENLVGGDVEFKNYFELNIVQREDKLLTQIRYLSKFQEEIPELINSFRRNVEVLMNQHEELLTRPKIEYLGGKSRKKVILVPPSMPYFGYSIIYKKIANLFSKNYEVYMLTHFKSDDILEEYISLVKKVVNDEVIVMGYSFGGTIAVEIARVLSKEGVKLEKIILFDSFVAKKDRFENLDLDEEETLEYLIKDFLNKKSSSQQYNNQRIEDLIDDYKLYHYATKSIYTEREVINCKIINFITENEVGWNGEKREDWLKFCQEYKEVPLKGEHTEIFDSRYFDENADTIVKHCNFINENGEIL